MQNDTIALVLGLTLGLAVVGVVLGLMMMNARAQQATTVLMPANSGITYQNEEKWSVVKDKDGRVQDIIVHRTATEK